MPPLRPAHVCSLRWNPVAFPRRFFGTAPRSNGTHARIVEVGPRDGLQNEKKVIPPSTKIELIERLANTGVSAIESGAFVSPKWVPQMESSEAILKHILSQEPLSASPISHSFLVPNVKGLVSLETILKAYPETFNTQLSTQSLGTVNKPTIELAVFAAATESFSQKNLNCDIATAITRFRSVIRDAKAIGLRVRAYISVALGCPYEGYNVDPQRVASIATDLLEAGADEISLGDTTGMGTAPRTSRLLKCVSVAGIRIETDVAMHFHDTYGQALVNTAIALEAGVRTFDASVGGLGGCPFSPGATGNVATEDMVYFLESLGMNTGVDLDAMAEIGAWITAQLGKAHHSSVGKAVLASRPPDRLET